MRRRRNAEIISGRLTTGGTILAADGEFLAVPSGTGIIAIKFPKNFRLLNAVAGIQNASAAGAVADAFGENEFVIRSFTAAGSPVGTTVTFIATGYYK